MTAKKQLTETEVRTILVREQVTEAEYARYKGLSDRTIRQWRHDRVIPFIRVGRIVLINWRAADAALEKYTRAPVSAQARAKAEATK